MDTNAASPAASSKRALSMVPARGLSMMLTLAVGVWFAAITTGLAHADKPAITADPTLPPAATTVAYSDLDVTTRDGARVLLHRINLAAKRICGPEPSHSPLQPREAAYYRDCVATSVDAAVAKVGSPALLALHDTQSSSSVSIAAR